MSARNVLLSVVFSFAGASTSFGQTAAPAARFVIGPLQWTPTLTLREAGLDSNVFNTQKDAKEDMTASIVPFVDSLLTLGIAQVATQGTAEYAYFQRYTNQRAINGRVSSRIAFPLSRIQPVATLSWAHVKERPSSEIDVRAPRTDRGYGGGLTTKLTSRMALSATIDRQDTHYDSGALFRGAELASQLNRQSTGITIGIRMAASPLTSFFVDGGASRDEFVVQRDRNTENLRGDLGFEFAPDAVIAGRAMIGYHKMQPQHASTGPGGALGFAGLTSSVSLSYTLLGRARFTPRFSRETTYSISTTQPYYLSTAGGLEILQTLVGPLDLLLRGGREKMDYPATDLTAARSDRVDTLGGGLSIRISTQGRIGLNYDDSKRRSDAGAEFGYARRHIYTTVTYGF